MPAPRPRPRPRGRCARRAAPPRVVAAIAVVAEALRRPGGDELLRQALARVGSPARCAACGADCFALKVGRTSYLLERRLRRSDPARGSFELHAHRCPAHEPDPPSPRPEVRPK